ncbi:hypothetical protein WUBG_01755 [Wuchereria bancrofti]|uniref:Uncharacterized protein n=1 Tax=Wuchereria bancrofti TaxID=6293 RepID=J9EXJ9_WUCBA|nr:hypothetical protein WUBG_01755 [Wuchereria bancrofti]
MDRADGEPRNRDQLPRRLRIDTHERTDRQADGETDVHAMHHPPLTIWWYKRDHIPPYGSNSSYFSSCDRPVALSPIPDIRPSSPSFCL